MTVKKQDGDWGLLSTSVSGDWMIDIHESIEERAKPFVIVFDHKSVLIQVDVQSLECLEELYGLLCRGNQSERYNFSESLGGKVEFIVSDDRLSIQVNRRSSSGNTEIFEVRLEASDKQQLAMALNEILDDIQNVSGTGN